MRDPANILDIIEKKKRGAPLSADEIGRWIGGVRAEGGGIPDYQLAALLMAIRLNGMTAEETRDLTLAMARSGDTLDLSSIDGVCVDKHSTGGVGDTTTLVLAPLVAACGAKVAKMSGRGLGHTGGTVDKLESIPGLRTELPTDVFLAQVRAIGCAVIGQSRALAPADKVLYALRDVTATVDSLPLIVSSIMSKKIAAGCGAIVLDVKTGSGALMPTLPASIELAEAMVEVGKLAGRPTTAIVTGMDQPLGTHIGNALEVKEAIDILSGRTQQGRLLDVSVRLGAMMLVAGGYARDEAVARVRLTDALRSGLGLAKLRQMIAAQGGDASVCDDPSRLPRAKTLIPVLADRGGYVTAMDTVALGEVSRRLGAGRVRKDDAIDPAVGLIMRVELGDRVEKGQTLLELHVNGAADVTEIIGDARASVRIGAERVNPPPLIQAIVRPDGVERLG